MNLLTNKQLETIAEKSTNKCKHIVNNPPKNETTLKQKLSEMQEMVNKVQSDIEFIERWSNKR